MVDSRMVGSRTVGSLTVGSLTVGSLTVSARQSGLRCAVCHGGLELGGTVTGCPACDSQYHPECRSELGRCATLGCRLAHLSTRPGVTVVPVVPVEARPGFFRSHFHPGFARPRPVYDAIFGIVLPIVCLAFDPMVFQGTGGGHGHHVLGPLVPVELRIPSFALMVAEMLFLAFWLILRPRARSVRVPLGVALLVGALFAFVLGLALLPMSLVGLLVIVGALGLTPLFTALVFLRNGMSALGRRDPSA